MSPVAAPIGNQFWRQRSTHGRKPIFAAPEDLWNAASEYFDWIEANPLHEAQAFAYKGEVTLQDIPKMRAMTLTGLCIFLDVTFTTWAEYKNREDFTEVSMRIDEIIRTQKFEGASAGLLNPAIIARDLGLTDKTEVNGQLVLRPVVIYEKPD